MAQEYTEISMEENESDIDQIHTEISIEHSQISGGKMNFFNKSAIMM